MADDKCINIKRLNKKIQRYIQFHKKFIIENEQSKWYIKGLEKALRIIDDIDKNDDIGADVFNIRKQSYFVDNEDININVYTSDVENNAYGYSVGTYPGDELGNRTPSYIDINFGIYSDTIYAEKTQTGVLIKSQGTYERELLIQLLCGCVEALANLVWYQGVKK